MTRVPSLASKKELGHRSGDLQVVYEPGNTGARWLTLGVDHGFEESVCELLAAGLILRRGASWCVDIVTIVTI